MAVSTSVPAWTLRMPAGSVQQWAFTFTVSSATGLSAYPISGDTWEYVARALPTDTGTPVISITTATTTPGTISTIATTALSQVTLTINPAATATLTPGLYYHALWSNPGTATATTWVTGNLIVEGNPQP